MTYEPIRPAGIEPLPKVRQMAMLVDVKNYAQLDLYSQIILRELPNDPHASLACAWVANHFGFREHFQQYIKAAKQGDRSIELMAQDLHIPIEQLTRPKQKKKPDDDKRFHLIKAWGFGFGSEMSALMGQAYIAELVGRTPIVHWGSNFLYRPSTGDNCVFACFFKTFNNLNIEDAKLHIDDCYPTKWNSANLHLEHLGKKNGQHSKLSALHYMNRLEKLTVADYYSGVVSSRPWAPSASPISHLSLDDAYRYLAKKYLIPQDDIVAQVDEFVVTNLDVPYVAVHARGSDKDEGYRALTSIPNQILAAAKQRLNMLGDEAKLFLMTDDMALLARYQCEFSERLVTTDCQRSESEVGVHYNNDTDKETAGREMLIDMLVAARANCFIGLGLSNPSQLIPYFGNFSDDDYVLFGENRLKQFNTHLYRTISVT